MFKNQGFEWSFVDLKENHDIIRPIRLIRLIQYIHFTSNRDPMLSLLSLLLNYSPSFIKTDKNVDDGSDVTYIVKFGREGREFSWKLEKMSLTSICVFHQRYTLNNMNWLQIKRIRDLEHEFKGLWMSKILEWVSIDPVPNAPQYSIFSIIIWLRILALQYCTHLSKIYT